MANPLPPRLPVPGQGEYLPAYSPQSREDGLVKEFLRAAKADLRHLDTAIAAFNRSRPKTPPLGSPHVAILYGNTLYGIADGKAKAAVAEHVVRGWARHNRVDGKHRKSRMPTVSIAVFSISDGGCPILT